MRHSFRKWLPVLLIVVIFAVLILSLDWHDPQRLHGQVVRLLLYLGCATPIGSAVAAAKKHGSKTAFRVFMATLIVSFLLNRLIWSRSLFTEFHREAITHALVMGHLLALSGIFPFRPRTSTENREPNPKE